MNLKKYLRQQAEKDAESLLTESDRQFCMQLAEMVQQNPAPNKRKRFNLTALAGSVATVLLIAVVLGVTLPFVLNKNIPVDEIHYKEENVTKIDCTIEDINSNAKYFQIVETGDATFRYVLNYDSVSGDELYYSLDVTTGISAFTLYIVVNENYNFTFKLSDNLLSEQLQKYKVNYEVKKGNGTANYLGYIKNESETVYIDYMQVVDIGEWLFFEEIQNVLKVKD